MKKTKIICTLGPACEDIATLKKMIRAGMNCARLNFSHGSYEQFDRLIRNVRTAATECSTPVAIIQDLQGPKIRVGRLPENGIPLKKFQKIMLKTTGLYNSNSKIIEVPVQYRLLPREVKTNDLIMMDDGLLEVKVLKTNGKNQILAQVITGGILKSHKGINVPGSEISAPALSQKDKKDLQFALPYKPDYIALSFVKSSADINQLRSFLAHHNSSAEIIAKIERSEAIDNLEDIISASDAVMVARGDLGIEIPPEQVPIIQKQIVSLCNRYAKPSIIATQMLQSMINNPRSTRAEISDAATTVFDHADAFMLSNETSVGKYPINATALLAQVARATEHELDKKSHLLGSFLPCNKNNPLDATCRNACELADEIQAKYIIAITKRGQTAHEVAKYRPKTPIIVITNNAHFVTQSTLIWGLNKIISDNSLSQKPFVNIAKTVNLLKRKKLIKKDDVLVFVNIHQKNHLIRTIAV